jgi:hypothetical protein
MNVNQLILAGFLVAARSTLGLVEDVLAMGNQWDEENPAVVSCSC